MDIVELGGVRLHVVGTVPGVPGESERVQRALARLAPAVVLADVDTDDALRLRTAVTEKRAFEPGFVDGLFAREAHARFAGDAKPGDHPLVTAARFARDKRAEFVPLRPIAPKPGFFARRRAGRAASAIDAKDPDALAAAFPTALADVWRVDAEIDAAHRRMVRALSDGRAPLVAIFQAHRRAAYEAALRNTGRIPA